MIYRFMRTILFFDLPSVTKTDHREYAKFTKFIKKKFQNVYIPYLLLSSITIVNVFFIEDPPNV